MQKMQVSHCNHTPIMAVQTPAGKAGVHKKCNQKPKTKLCRG